MSDRLGYIPYPLYATEAQPADTFTPYFNAAPTEAQPAQQDPRWFMPDPAGTGSSSGRMPIDFSQPYQPYSWWQDTPPPAVAATAPAASPPASPDAPMPTVHIGPDGKPDRPPVAPGTYSGATTGRQPPPAATKQEAAKPEEKKPAPPDPFAAWNAWYKQETAPRPLPQMHFQAAPEPVPWMVPLPQGPPASTSGIAQPVQFAPQLGAQTGGSYSTADAEHEATAARYRRMLGA